MEGGCGTLWGSAAGLNVHGDACLVALLFKTVCAHFCFLLSPMWSCWLSQAGAGPFSDLVDQPLIPC